MPDSPSLEERLTAITPPKVSRQTQVPLDTLIDDLAMELPEEQSLEMPIHESPSSNTWNGWGSVAAIFVAILGVCSALIFSLDKNRSISFSAALDQSPIQLVAMDNSPAVVRIEEEIQGQSVIQVGSEWPVQSTRYRIVTEHKLVDAATGTVVTVLEPSEELELTSQQVF